LICVAVEEEEEAKEGAFVLLFFPLLQSLPSRRLLRDLVARPLGPEMPDCKVNFQVVEIDKLFLPFGTFFSS
jgi:hypothetical protein